MTSASRELFSRRFEPNPVLLFELRQAVRNRFVLTLLLVYLATLSVLFGVTLVCHESRPDILKEITGYFFLPVGNGLFAAQLVQVTFQLFYLFAVLTLVGYGAGRMAADRLNENSIFYTTLPVWRITLGKFLFGFIVLFLFLSVTLPFLTIAYILRGVDLYILISAAVTFPLLIQLQYVYSLAFFAGIKTRKQLITLAFPSLFLQVILMFFALNANVSEEVMEETFWKEFFAWFGYILMFTMSMLPGLLMITALIAPEMSNRMFPVRVILTAVLVPVVLATCTCALFFELKDAEHFVAVIIGSMIFLFFIIPFFFPIFICEREILSPRIRRTIPKGFFGRLVRFPLYTGAAGAMCWAVLFLIFSALAVGVVYCNYVYHYKPSSKFEFFSDLDAIRSLFNFALTVFNYSATSLLVYHFFLRHRMSKRLIWIPVFLAIAAVPAWLLLEDIYSKSTGSALLLSPYQDEWLYCFTPGPLFWVGEPLLTRQLVVGLIWFALIAPFGLVCFWRSFKDFDVSKNHLVDID